MVTAAAPPSEEEVDMERFKFYLDDQNREGYHIDVCPDSTGHLATGIGHKVTPADNLTGDDRISYQDLDECFRKDGGAALDAARAQMVEAGIQDQDFLLALASVNFQLGLHWKRRFPKTCKHIMEGEYDKAATEVEESRWRVQTPERSAEFQNALRALAQRKDARHSLATRKHE